MKTKTKKLTIIGLLTVALMNISVKAEEVTLPIINKPAILEEGTQRVLTPAQIAELLPWAKNSKVFLLDLLESINGLTTLDKVERLADGIQTVVGESAPKNSELLMRYALNRGIVINDILSKEMDADAVGSQDVRLRVLRESINMAIKYYDIDLATLTKKSAAPFVLFGLDYFEFLSELNKSVFDASAQYNIQRTALEWLQWDLYRDLNNTSYASQIVKINNAIKTFPARKMTDAQAIANIRLMKQIAQQLRVKETLKKVEEDKKLSEARNEEERKLLLAKSEEERQRILREIEIEKLRGHRSQIDMEKFRVNSGLLNAGSWSTRRDAVYKLHEILGGDVTMLFLNRIFVETDADVFRALKTSLDTRLGKQSYTMKIESFEALQQNIYGTLTSQFKKTGSWSMRRQIIYWISYFPTIETYRQLASWKDSESDSDVRAAIIAEMNRLEKLLK